MKQLLVDFAYFLNTSSSYQAKKHFFYNILENDRNKYKKYIDMLMIVLIFISVGVLIGEVKHHVNLYLIYFSTYFISLVFFIEYILRLWVSSSVSAVIVKQAQYDTFLGREINLQKSLIKAFKQKLKYILSVRAIIDLLAILPFFHELRLLRIFILFRVFKLFRYAKSFQTLSSVLATKKFEFITLAMFSSIVIFVSSVLIYIMEANNPTSPIDTLYEAIYWSIVTISTVGYGDITPITNEGRFVAMLVIIAGIAVLAFTTSLVVSAFTERLDEIKEVKNIEDISKLKHFYLICGYDKVAKELGKKLARKNHVIVLDNRATKIEEAKSDGLVAMQYDPGKVDSYKKLNIEIKTQVKTVLSLYEDDVLNVYTALTIRSIDKDVNILSLLMEDVNRKKLEFAGINHIVYPQNLVGLITRELVGKPAAFEVIKELINEGSTVKIDELIVTARIVDNYPTVGDLNNKRFRVLLLGVYKGAKKQFYFNPIDSTIIEPGDYLLVVGYRVFINEFNLSLQKRANNG